MPATQVQPPEVAVVAVRNASTIHMTPYEHEHEAEDVGYGQGNCPVAEEGNHASHGEESTGTVRAKPTSSESPTIRVVVTGPPRRRYMTPPMAPTAVAEASSNWRSDHRDQDPVKT